MKLRNKKTGIIGELHFEPDKEYHFTVVTEDPADVMIYKKLAALYADWEDYDEPKEYWRIDCDGTLTHGRDEFNTPFDNACKSLDNYFETEEEAKKAVEKLKAWKRLKDKGFRFEGYDNISSISRWRLELIDSSEYAVQKDLNLLFGGEE